MPYLKSGSVPAGLEEPMENSASPSNTMAGMMGLKLPRVAILEPSPMVMVVVPGEPNTLKTPSVLETMPA